jgi:hypothetical protein
MAGRNWSCLSTSVHPLMLETILIAALTPVQQFGFRASAPPHTVFGIPHFTNFPIFIGNGQGASLRK